ncbi:MAG TPA: glycosyltransferase family 4 protein [Algoriphagus sp.]|nr:glycosyltransferase family 4 protein [Algoriphagus sp.]
MKIFAYNDFILKKWDDSVYSDDSHILFIKATCQDHFDSFKLGSRVSKEASLGFYHFSNQSSEVLELPYYDSVADFLKKPSLFWKSYKLLKSQLKEFDLFWITWPHPVSFLILWMFGSKKPVVLFVRQNLEALIDVRYRGVQRAIGLLFTRLVYKYAAFFHPQAILVTVGEEMYHRLSPDFSAATYVSDSIVPEEFACEPRTGGFFDPIKLLFVGRLEPEKGLNVLIEAVKLISQKKSVRLSLIGDGISRDEAKELVERLGLTSSVSFEGYVPFGEKLFSIYRDHDILMISSFSEGLPKIVNEARAFALPVVSTEVGGIANELKHEQTCLFVKPGNPAQLAEAALRLTSDLDLYSKISRNLSEEFQENSLQFWSKKFSDFVKINLNTEK